MRKAIEAGDPPVSFVFGDSKLETRDTMDVNNAIWRIAAILSNQSHRDGVARSIAVRMGEELASILEDVRHDDVRDRMRLARRAR